MFLWIFFIEEVSMKLNTPYECGMEATASCRDLIGLWVVGSKGECMHPKAGFRLGKNGYRHLAVQASIQIAIVSKLVHAAQIRGKVLYCQCLNDDL